MKGWVKSKFDNPDQKNKFEKTIITNDIRNKFYQLLLKFSEVI
jgi:hypothetical protein